jgi:hypothetical protein
MRRWQESVGKRLVLAALALGGLTGASATADDPPVSVVDWLKAKGEDASLEARRAAYARLVGGGAYTGSAEQNVLLLRALTASRGAPGARPTSANGAQTAPRTLRQHDVEVTYDPSSLVLHLELEVDVRWAGGRRSPMDPTPQERVEEPAVLPTLPRDGATFVSAAVLAQKAKQFDDGLYAAVEEAFEVGDDGKREMLRRIRARLAAAGARDRGAEVVEAAARLGAVPGNGPDGIEAAVVGRLAEFEGDAKRSKTIGFYPWPDELKRVFRQDRMLQTELERKDVRSVVEALDADPAARATYVRMLTCYERLTNPYASADLRGMLGRATGPASDDRVRVLPPSRAHETELAKRLWKDRPIPEGANLMDLLVAEVQSGKLSLAPTAASGWYDRQTWAYEPLLRPESTPEAPHVTCGERYRKYLVELFKGLLALTRETHVKQLECWASAMAMARPAKSPISVELPFTVEPLPTHYARRADAYAFVRTVLEQTFGPASVAALHRLTADGPVSSDLATELTFMETLFRGAAEVSRAEIGAPAGGKGPEVEAARSMFRWWTGTYGFDPDLAADARMMVPVFFDAERQQTKVWVFLGWTRQALRTSVLKQPRVLKAEKLTELPTWDGQVNFYVPGTALYAPVVAEIYVTRILDRTEMRRRCDERKTRSAILASLR